MNQSSMSESFNGGNKLKIKLANASVTKRVGETPENFEALKKTVRAQICKDELAQSLLEKNMMEITYQDDVGDVINVSDDEDLLAAYEVAESSMNGQIKFFIKPRQVIQPKISISSRVQGQPEIADPGSSIPISQEFIQAAIKHTVQGVGEDTEIIDQMSEDDSSDSVDLPQDKKTKGKKKGPKPRKSKEANQGLPRKAFKRLIKKELDKQCGQIFNDLYNCPQIAEMKKMDEALSGQAGEVVDHKVECDGCGKAPIVGVRYKCSICKDFDFCSNCEERKDHDHAFLKIVDPRQTPRAIIAVIDEHMQNAQADIDQNLDQNPNLNWVASLAQHIGTNARTQLKNHQNRPPNVGFGGPEAEMWKDAQQTFPGQASQGHRGPRGEGVHKRKRGQIVKIPQGPIFISPGETVFAEVELRNETYYPFKQGCALRSFFTGRAAQDLSAVNIPIDVKVEGMTNFKISIPLDLTEKVAESQDEIVADFALTGPRGGAFGEPIQLKLKMFKQMDDSQFFQKKVHEELKAAGLECSLGDVVEALKNAGNDVEAAKKAIKEKLQIDYSLAEHFETQMQI